MKDRRAPLLPVVATDQGAEEAPRGQGGVGAGWVERNGLEGVAERGPAGAETRAGQRDAEDLFVV